MNNERFIDEVKLLGINLTDKQLKDFDIYCNELLEYNKHTNLTAIRNVDDVYLKHFYDSLTISKIIKLDNQTLCDIGTGAGFPGIVLKIFYPSLEVTLVDATLKKCHFLELVIKELSLDKIKVLNKRAEEYSKETREHYDIVTSRAVAPLKHLLEYSIPLLKINGIYIAMKSDISKEIEGIENYENKLKISKEKTIKFELPIENSLRTLISYKKIEKTPIIYPRK